MHVQVQETVNNFASSSSISNKQTASPQNATEQRTAFNATPTTCHHGADNDVDLVRCVSFSSAAQQQQLAERPHVLTALHPLSWSRCGQPFKWPLVATGCWHGAPFSAFMRVLLAFPPRCSVFKGQSQPYPSNGLTSNQLTLSFGVLSGVVVGK